MHSARNTLPRERYVEQSAHLTTILLLEIIGMMTPNFAKVQVCHPSLDKLTLQAPGNDREESVSGIRSTEYRVHLCAFLDDPWGKMTVTQGHDLCNYLTGARFQSSLSDYFSIPILFFFLLHLLYHFNQNIPRPNFPIVMSTPPAPYNKCPRPNRPNPWDFQTQKRAILQGR